MAYRVTMSQNEGDEAIPKTNGKLCQFYNFVNRLCVGEIHQTSTVKYRKIFRFRC